MKKAYLNVFLKGLSKNKGGFILRIKDALWNSTL